MFAAAVSSFPFVAVRWPWAAPRLPWRAHRADLQSMAAPTVDFDLAKTEPPSLRRAVARPHLVEKLGQDRDLPRWLHAAPGSGKSILARQYVQHSERAPLWYRLDDNDPAFFFAAFAQACAKRLGVKEALPRFTDADHGREAEFARRLLRSLRAALDFAVLIVFDDAHRPTGAALWRALTQFIAIADGEMELLFVAETPPPAACFDAIAAGRLTVCNDLDLRFDRDQCRALAGALRLPPAVGDRLATMSSGHAGALVLAGELLRASGGTERAAQTVADQIHGHLLASLLDRLPPQHSELALRAGILPLLTPQLAAALVKRDADEVAADLRALAERGLVAPLDGADGEFYELHSLVRQGARRLFAQRYGDAAARALAADAAQALEAAGHLPEAVDTLLDAGLVDAAGERLPALAERYARERRPTLLLRVLDRVPAAQIDARPWVAYWTGHTLQGVNEGQARPWFDRAWRGFEAQGDRVGMALTAASMSVVFALDYSDLAGIDEWRARLHRLWPDGSALTGEARNLWLLGAVADTIMAEPGQASAEQAEQALSELRRRVLQPEGWISLDQRVEAARVMMDCASVLFSVQTALQIASETRLLAEHASTAPLPAARWLLVAADSQRRAADYPAAQASLDIGQRLATQAEYAALHFEVGINRLVLLLSQRQDDQALALLTGLEGESAHAQPFQRARLGQLASRLLLRQGRATESVQRAQAALELARSDSSSSGHTRLFQTQLVFARAAAGEFDQAARLAHEVANSLVGRQHQTVKAIAHAMEYFASKGTAADSLRSAWLAIEQSQFLSILQDVPDLVARLCAAALQQSITAQTALRVIEAQRLTPPVEAGPTWPWSVRVRAIGGFALEVDGLPYSPARKAADRPLDLLKALLAAEALGCTGADRSWLMQRLWPDADEVNARKTLDMAILRLRKLLGRDEAVEVAEGRVRLNRTLLWSDVHEFKQAIARLTDAYRRQPTAPEDAAPQLRAALTALTDAYRGPFLAGDEDSPWLLAAREHLAREFRIALTRIDPAASGLATDALAEALERARQAEPLAEDLARALMQLRLSHGDRTAALNVYRSLRDRLRTELGMTPSPQTEALRARIVAIDSD
jgi:LuxR family maltose regulon positive regulatory protein